MPESENTGRWWTRSWNVVRGCSPVGAGCDHCWAARMAVRFNAAATFVDRTAQMGGAEFRDPLPFCGFAEIVEGTPRWTGRVELVESMLGAPLHWRKPAVVAVSLMGDWMHENLPDEARDRILGVEAQCPQHTFIHLTKRWKAQASYLGDEHTRRMRVSLTWPLPNVIIGASAWDQASADAACHWLLQTPAATRLLCLEPLLGLADLGNVKCPGAGYMDVLDGRGHDGVIKEDACGPALDWVIVGVETGPRARNCEWGWIHGVVRQCRDAGVPVWVKALALMDEKGRRLPYEQWPAALQVRQRPEGRR